MDVKVNKTRLANRRKPASNLSMLPSTALNWHDTIDGVESYESTCVHAA